MSTETDIREFLTTRRAKLTPERVGLPTFGRQRRVAGLRREEVALLAGISVEYYTRLERGNARGVSDDVLGAVSAALQLDEAEHEHLVDLVRTLNDTRRPRKAPAPAQLRTDDRVVRG
jgi:transcriptional regulator with XRE-family HTH domain